MNSWMSEWMEEWIKDDGNISIDISQNPADQFSRKNAKI